MSTQTDLTPLHPLYTCGPVFYHPELESWQVPNYRDVVDVLRLQYTGSVGREGAYSSYEAMSPAIRAMWLRDEPAHASLRGLVERDFRPEAIAPLKAPMAEKARELLASRVSSPHGHIDLVEEYAVPLTRYALCDLLLGISFQEQDWLRAWQDAHPTALLLDESGFVPALKLWLEHGAQRPGSVLATLLALYHQQAPIAGTPMNLDDLVSFFDMFAVGAYESLRTNVATALVTLIEGDALTVLRKQRDRAEFPALLSSAREEALRYAPSYPCVSVMTRAEIVLGGQAIPKDATLVIWLSAANRDPAVYKDPDQFDLFRFLPKRTAPSKTPLTFGYGMHHCLGAAFSRELIQVAIEAFVDLVPGPVRLKEAVTYYDYYGVDHSIKQASILYGKQALS